jgi:hypothetical protein
MNDDGCLSVAVGVLIFVFVIAGILRYFGDVADSIASFLFPFAVIGSIIYVVIELLKQKRGSEGKHVDVDRSEKDE